MEMRNGVLTSFWYDWWSPYGRLIDISGTREFIDLEIKIDDSLEHVLKTHKKKKHHQERNNVIENIIVDQRTRGMVNGDDVVLWRKNDDVFKPSFNKKSTWNLVRERTQIQKWWKRIWFSYATPKYAFHSWLASHNRLAIRDRMLLWNVGVDGSCILYQTALETQNHIYFECRYSEAVWGGLVRNLIASNYTANWDRIQNILNAK